MPWTDKPGGNGSNSNGSGGGDDGRGPWGQPPRGPGGGGNNPPDLEELLKSGRERFRKTMGGRGGSGGPGLSLPSGRMLPILLIVALGLWAASGVYFVQPGERGVVTTFGKYTELTFPGGRWHIPWPFQEKQIVPVDLEQSTPIGLASGSRASTENSMLTSDLNIVDVTISVNWKIKDGAAGENELPGAAKFLFNNEDVQGLVKAVAESALREVVGANELDPIISNGRAIVPQNTQALMQQTLDDYDSGIEIIRVNFQKSDPPTQVIDSFRDVIDARSDAETTINDATREANEIVPQARGDAQRLVLDAQAYEARVTAEARGAASRFNDIYSEYAKAPEVTRQRMYLETLEGVLGDMNKIVIDGEAGGTVPYLSLNELTKQRNQN